MMIAGNWKMNLNVQEASLLLNRLSKNIKSYRNLEVVLAPNFVALQPLSVEVDGRKFKLAAQNAFSKDEGAYTGEVSFTMLRGLVDYVIIGHSERRLYFSESLENIRDKVQAATRNDITPILCIGETKQERAAGETKRVVHDQLTTAIANLTSAELEDLVIAYEPVWAISTFGGEVAKPEDIKVMLELIRTIIKELYGADAAEAVRLLYGGSVDNTTASTYLSISGCNGALVGGASLNYQKFTSIVETAHKLQLESSVTDGRDD